MNLLQKFFVVPGLLSLLAAGALCQAQETQTGVNGSPVAAAAGSRLPEVVYFDRAARFEIKAQDLPPPYASQRGKKNWRVSYRK